MLFIFCVAHACHSNTLPDTGTVGRFICRLEADAGGVTAVASIGEGIPSSFFILAIHGEASRPRNVMFYKSILLWFCIDSFFA